MTTQDRRDTPGGVAIVAVLAMVVGTIQLLAGIVLLVFNNDADGYTSTEAIVAGIILIVTAAIYIWVGRGLMRLNPVALFIGLVVSGFRAAYDIGWVLGVGLDGIGFGTLISLAFNVLVFSALFSGRGAFGRS